MIDVKSGKVQLGIGIPTLLAAALAFADVTYVDHGELDVQLAAAMNQVTRDRREDKLYTINKVIAKYKVTQSERKLEPEELQRLFELQDEAARLKRLLGGS